MLLLWSRKVIFLHIYKTGGTSITHALLSQLSPAEKIIGRIAQGGVLPLPQWRLQACTLPPHPTARELREILPPRVFDTCFKFAFVRNPWSLQLSLFRHVRRSPTHHQHNIFAAFPDFNAYIEWIGSLPNGRHRVQCDFVMDEVGKPMVDFIGRFENLTQDFAAIANQFGWRANLPHFNKSDEDPNFRKYYTTRSRDIVAALHRADIDTFGYDFGAV
jgi:hypothetical protein